MVAIILAWVLFAGGHLSLAWAIALTALEAASVAGRVALVLCLASRN